MPGPKPTTYALAERRRSPRRRLRQPAEIVLHGTGVNDGWHCQAALLNLSSDGLACRVPESARGRSGAAKMIFAVPGQTLRVVFRLGASSPAFDLNGRIVNITQGGTPEHLVLGLEFLADKSLEVSRPGLLDALKMNEATSDQ